MSFTIPQHIFSEESQATQDYFLLQKISKPICRSISIKACTETAPEYTNNKQLNNFTPDRTDFLTIIEEPSDGTPSQFKIIPHAANYSHLTLSGIQDIQEL